MTVRHPAVGARCGRLCLGIALAIAPVLTLAIPGWADTAGSAVSPTGGSGDNSTASAGSPGGTSTLLGYGATLQSIGVQYVFTIPSVIPVSGNVIEEDLPFARTSLNNGPVINALGAPYYPGDILANLGSLFSEFAPGAPVPNDPLLAEADYPASSGHGASASFGGNPPPGSPLAPNVFSATAQAGAGGADVAATLAGLQVGSSSSTSSVPLRLGQRPPGAAATSPALSSPAAGAPDPSPSPLEVGTVQSLNHTVITGSSVQGAASTIVKAVSVAAVLDISEISSSATAGSDGSQGTPDAKLHLIGVTVDGQPAYIDNQGVHVTGTTVTADGVTPQEAQTVLDETFNQDGISVRVAEPSTDTKGAEAVANSGGLVVSVTHPFTVPYLPGEPSIPVPGLGNQGLPAGNYTATTSLTIGLATSDVQASTLLPSPAGSGEAGAGSLLGSALGGGGSFPGSTESFAANPTVGGSTGGPGDLPFQPRRAASLLPFGIPAPVAWIFFGTILCVLTSYPLLRVVRWQFLSERMQ